MEADDERWEEEKENGKTHHRVQEDLPLPIHEKKENKESERADLERDGKGEQKPGQDLAACEIIIKNAGHKKERDDPELSARERVQKHGEAEDHGESDLPGCGAGVLRKAPGKHHGSGETNE